MEVLLCVNLVADSKNKNSMTVFENVLLRETVGPERFKVIGGRRKMDNKFLFVLLKKY